MDVPRRGVHQRAPPPEIYNLPLVLAYAVLDQVLDELVDQGVIQLPVKKKNKLFDKMKASTAPGSALAWQNYQLVDAGRDDRNKVAHEAVLYDRATSVKYVAAIEAELRAWGVL